MSLLGACSAPNTQAVVVNELTTIASVYSLSPFMASVQAVGMGADDGASFASALNNAAELVDMTTALTPGAVPSGMEAPIGTINSLGNVIDACVQSQGGQAGDGTSCGKLFQDTCSSESACPTNTVDATLAIAKNPSNAVSDIFDVGSVSSVFQPSLSSAPADWTLQLFSTPPSPSFSPGPGSLMNGQSVALADSAPAAAIYYTVDGTTPTSASQRYTLPIILKTSATIRAIAVAGTLSSSLASAAYVLPTAKVLAFATQPTDVVLGTSLQPLTVVSLDEYGNQVSPGPQPVTVTLGGGAGGVLQGDLTELLSGTSTVFANLAPSQAGSGYTITASSSGLRSAISGSFNVISPLMTLSMPAQNVLVGGSLVAGLSLATKAGSGGVTVHLTSNSAGLRIASPTVFISPGQTSATFSVQGITPGQATVTATAANYITASTTLAVANPSAPLVTKVFSLGVVPASQLATGLGFNVGVQEWEYQMASALGATHVRFQCGWSDVEHQTAPPQNQDEAVAFSLNPPCVTAFAFAKKYNLQPTVVAGYGSPFHTILTVTVPEGANAGATTLHVKLAAGIGGDTFASLRPSYDTFSSTSGFPLTNKFSGAGGYIASFSVAGDEATLTLASALTTALPAGSQQYYINEFLYPPAATTSPNDPSVQAYVRYATWLATQINASGNTGEVEIWNEPPWNFDPWDIRQNFYDVWPGAGSPGPQNAYIPNFGFAAALQAANPHVPGVNFNWAGTEKNGYASLVSQFPGFDMKDNTGVTFSAKNSPVSTESFHPYGNIPEQDIWDPACLQATLGKYPALPAFTWGDCAVVPGSSSNMAYAMQYTMYQRSGDPTSGLNHNISETGFTVNGEGDELHKARFSLRQFLGFEAVGITPVQFYEMSSQDQGGFGFANGPAQPLPAYSALSRLMTDVNLIKGTPASYAAQNLPSVVSYAGVYPLDAVCVIGTGVASGSNSVLYTVWQQSMTSGAWGSLAQPASVSTTLSVPSPLQVAKVQNLVTGAAVLYSVSGQQLSLNVSDDPIEILFTPK